MGSLIEHAASRLLDALTQTHSSGDGQPGACTADEALAGIGCALELAAAASEAVPQSLLRYARDTSQPEPRRLRVLQLLHTSTSGDRDEGLKLRLHARCTVRAAWEHDSPALLASALDGFGDDAEPLDHPDAMRAAFSRLLPLATAGRHLQALATLVREWRGSINKRHSEDGGAPALHEDALALLVKTLRVGGSGLLPAVRAACAPAPILTLDEERELADTMGGAPDAPRTRLMSALLSGWPVLEEEALEMLTNSELAAPVAPDEPLVELLLDHGWLPRLVRTTYWPRLVDHLSQPGHGAIAKQVVCTLSAVAHYGAAGEIVLSGADAILRCTRPPRNGLS